MSTSMFEALKKASPSLASQFDPTISDDARLVNRAKSGKSISLAQLGELINGISVHGTHKRYTEVIFDDLTNSDKIRIGGKNGEIRTVSFYIRDIHQLSKHEVNFDEMCKLGILGSDRVFFPVTNLPEIISDFWEFRSSIYYNESSRDTVHVCLYKI